MHARQCIAQAHLLLYLRARTAVVIPVINATAVNFIKIYKQHKNRRHETRSHCRHPRYYTQPTARNSWEVLTPGERHWILFYFSTAVCGTDCPSVLWRCWLGGRKGIRPVKNWVVGCWHSHLSGARCRLACGPADATSTHCLLLQ